MPRRSACCPALPGSEGGGPGPRGRSWLCRPATGLGGGGGVGEGGCAAAPPPQTHTSTYHTPAPPHSHSPNPLSLPCTRDPRRGCAAVRRSADYFLIYFWFALSWLVVVLAASWSRFTALWLRVGGSWVACGLLPLAVSALLSSLPLWLSSPPAPAAAGGFSEIWPLNCCHPRLILDYVLWWWWYRLVATVLEACKMKGGRRPLSLPVKNSLKSVLNLHSRE